jgi:hypothetical protein
LPCFGGMPGLLIQFYRKIMVFPKDLKEYALKFKAR